MAEDRFKAYKANVALQNEYREAYAALAASDPAAALRMPHPDATDFDVAAALDAIRRRPGALKADPRLDVKG